MSEADTTPRNTTASTRTAGQSTTSPTAAQGPAGQSIPPRRAPPPSQTLGKQSHRQLQEKRRISRPRLLTQPAQIRTRTTANANAKPETRVAGDPIANPAAAGEEDLAGYNDDDDEEGGAEAEDEGEEGEVDETIPVDESDETSYPTISDGQGSGHANKVGSSIPTQGRGGSDRGRALPLKRERPWVVGGTEKPAAIAQAWRETPAQTTTSPRSPPLPLPWSPGCFSSTDGLGFNKSRWWLTKTGVGLGRPALLRLLCRRRRY